MTLSLIALVAACEPPPPFQAGAGGTLGTWTIDACPATGTHTDPLSLSPRWDGRDLGRERGSPTELVEPAVSADGRTAFVGGQGGLFAVDLSTGALLDTFPEDPNDRFTEVSLDGTRVVATHWDRGSVWLDVADPADLRELARLPLTDAGALLLEGDVLWVAHMGGALASYDLADGSRMLGSGGSLVTPTAIERVGEHLIVADNSQGLVVFPVDGDEPLSPTVVPVALGAADLDADGSLLVVAAASAGVEIFDLADAATPRSLGVSDVGQAVTGVALADGVAWAVSHQEVAALDVSDAANPVLLGRETLEEWGLGVSAVPGEDRAVVAAWSFAEVVNLDRGARAPSALVTPDAVFPYAGETAWTVAVRNLGPVALTLGTPQASEPRFEASLDRQSVPTGEEASLTLRWAGEGSWEGEEVRTQVCVGTDDPDRPALAVELASDPWNEANQQVGSPAADFVLDDVDGVTHRLSDQLGHPVYLAYFATW